MNKKKGTRWGHISDTHIKNLKFHYEYKVVFEQLYQTLREQKVDYIVHCGDIAHTKTQISPEFVDMCSDFFRSLAEIAPTYIICGNHDGNLKNSSRQDALSPIVDALNLTNLYLLKDSGETHVDDKFCLNVLSVFDRANWIKPTDDSKINIALYHGSISNCKTDINWTMANGEDELNIFDDFDFAMLGDIHRRQFLDKDGRVWYAGSTVQQNHGETDDKGILIWDIESKDDWDIEPIVFKNPRPFFTIQLTPKGRMPRNIEVSENARLRLVSNNNLPLNTMKRAMEIAKHRFKPESISFLNRAAGQRGNVEEFTNSLLTDNLRDLKIQEELIDEYLTDFQVESKTLETVYELNRKYNEIVMKEEEISRNVNWKLVSFKWDNLFNYGEGNSVDFDNIGGIVGIFGKNFSGKSSIIDGILYTLFNTTSKNERKNLNIINQHKDYGSGELEIEIGHKIYNIRRMSTKYTKRLHGKETLEAKTELNFEVHDTVTGETTSLNGLTRSDTDANIRKYFGSMEDFLVSSLSSQHHSLAFLDEGSTKRKEIIAKFLDLEQFDRKFKLAKEDSIDARAALKKLEDRNYTEEHEEATLELDSLKAQLDVNQTNCDHLQEAIVSLTTESQTLQTAINSMPENVINLSQTKAKASKKRNQLASLEEQTAEYSRERQEATRKSEIAAKLLKTLDIVKLNGKQEIIDEQLSVIADYESQLAEVENSIESSEKKTCLLDGIPCGDSYPACKFIRDANAAVGRLPVLGTERTNIQAQLKQAQQKSGTMNAELVAGSIQKHNRVVEESSKLERKLESLGLTIERNQSAMTTLDIEIQQIDNKIKEYNENREVIENLEHLTQQMQLINTKIASKGKQLEVCKSKTFEHYRQVGSLEQRIEEIERAEKETSDLRREYAAYDLFMRCMHSNGIAYDVIKKKIPVINQEIAQMLANIVDFEISFSSNGNKLDIFIKHPKHDARPIEMGSGAEKTVAAMAIRLALLSVSSLPKGDIFVLDEPGTALDEENMEGFIRILELIKVYFKNVFLISHLDSLKDCVDMQVVIEKKAGYARVNQ